MQTDIAISFQPFGVEHLPGAAALSRDENWPHRIEDWGLIHSLSRGVVVLADGDVAGTAFVTRFGPVAMANMIIVGKALRGKGLGRRLMEEAMALQTPDEWRLVATADGLPLYRKLGFEETCVIAQHQGVLSDLPAVQADERLGWAKPEEAAAIAALDTVATGMERLPLIEAILKTGRIAIIREAGGIIGYAALRAFGRGDVAGPVIARSTEEAQALLAFLFAGQAGRFMRVDTTTDSGLSRWLERAGLAHVGGGIAMSRINNPARGIKSRISNPAVSPDTVKSFALAAQALG